jgi:hypothetical protein
MACGKRPQGEREVIRIDPPGAIESTYAGLVTCVI